MAIQVVALASFNYVQQHVSKHLMCFLLTKRGSLMSFHLPMPLSTTKYLKLTLT
jgi:hypothetical protein